MKSFPIVALIGQTNAGKSSLLNRFKKANIAIVAREEGTTRDNVITTIDGLFRMVDTAGLKAPTDDFERGIQSQIDDAIDSADLLLLTIDSSHYPDDRDKLIAKRALKSKKPVFLILNKSDIGSSLSDTDFLRLGIKSSDIYHTSATTGQGIRELKSAILHTLSTKLPKSGEKEEEKIKLALIGRPNVGKSSLFNSLGKKQQALVSSRQGTTRDINRLSLRFKNQTIEILDTAGLRRPGKREVGIEKFSAIRTLSAIEESDICALLIDSTEPHSKLDQSLAGEIVKAGKGIIVVLTKTDLVPRAEIDKILDDLENDFNFIPFAPVLLTSSLTGNNVAKLFDLTLEINETRHQEIKTSDLNKILEEAILEHKPAGLKNTHPKPKYIVQTDTNPAWFVVHGHDLELLHWSWKRFLENKLREKYPFVGTPIFFSYRSDKS